MTAIITSLKNQIFIPYTDSSTDHTDLNSYI